MKTINGQAGMYAISSIGEVESYKYNQPRTLKPTRDDGGYFTVSLYVNKKRKTVRVHRLVAETYIPNPKGLPCVNHKDGNKLNNDVNNLEWCTYSENTQHAVKNKLVNFNSGVKNHNSKLSKKQVEEIKIKYINGGCSHRSLAMEFNVSKPVIANIINGKSYL